MNALEAHTLVLKINECPKLFIVEFPIKMSKLGSFITRAHSISVNDPILIFNDSPTYHSMACCVTPLIAP